MLLSDVLLRRKDSDALAIVTKHENDNDWNISNATASSYARHSMGILIINPYYQATRHMTKVSSVLP